MDLNKEDARRNSMSCDDVGKGGPASSDVPDPPEDDLDDLDDILDDFASSAADSAPYTRNAEAQSRSGEADHENPGPSTKQLQDEMITLLGGLTPSSVPETLFKDVAQGLEKTAKQDTLGNANQTDKGDDSFHDSIRKTMERIQVTSSQADSAGVETASDGILEQLLKEMQNGDMPSDGDEEGLNQMLLGMMEQLTNKDILYDPMKELHGKFPTWLEKNRDKINKGDIERYELQHTLVNEIVDRFERKDYSDSNSSDRDFIVDRMQKMQAAGSPPADLVGDMEATEALGEIDPTCAQQ